MATYLYKNNVSPRDGFDLIDLQLDNGSTAVIRRGGVYELTANEVARASRFIVLTQSSAPVEQPVEIARLPIIGTPDEGDVPVWSSSDGAFVPSQISGVSGQSSLRFEQDIPYLAASRPYHVVGFASYNRARVTIDSAVTSTVAVVRLLLNGVVEATLTLTNGQASALFTIAIHAADGDALVVERLDAAGGGIVVEVDGNG